MKPIYLEFCGVNSFSEKAEIDFAKLLEGGLFGIFGDTGSGKSTILDCIHFALYGEIERAKTATDSINDKCDSEYVVYEFEITHDGGRHVYLVRRERRRKNSAAKAWLYEKDGGGNLLALAEGATDTDKKLREIIGLNFDDFKKCIALPQGEFAGLVKAQPRERLQLVSRLFDLDKYGEKLSAAIRERCAAAETTEKLLEAKMQETERGTAENVAAEEAKLRNAKEEAKLAEEKLAEAEKKYFSEKKLSEEKAEYDKLCLALNAAEQKLGYYSDLKEKSERFSAAVAALEKADEESKNAVGAAGAREAIARAELSLRAAKEETELRRRRFEESGVDGEIEKNTQTLGTLVALQSDIEACEAAKKKLNECIAAYNEIKNKAPEEDFAAELAENDKATDALGTDESFTEFLRRRFKDVLMSETYGEIRSDLRDLAGKYPETEEDVDRLLKKYAAGDIRAPRTADVAAAQLEFREAEKKRRALKEERERIEKRKAAYEENEREKKRISEDGKHYRERYLEAEKKIALVKETGTLSDVRKRIETLKGAKRRAEEEIRAGEEKIAALSSEIAKQRALEETYSSLSAAAKAEKERLLKEGGFADETEARLLKAEIGDDKRAKASCEKFFSDYNVYKARKAGIPEGKFEGFSQTRLTEAEREKTSFAARKDEAVRAVAVGEKVLEELNVLRERRSALEREYQSNRRELGLWEKLRSLTQRGRFMEFIASEYLQEICVSASKTLLSLTGGRYFLRYDDEFKAGDNLNAGALRSVRTLSGGETFLVSLSLALALSGAICAKSLRPIEFFFLDEGFGTLDEKLVDTVMDVLEKLKSKSFSVGVISHVEELKHRIDNKILVTGATDAHGSLVRVEAY